MGAVQQCLLMAAFGVVANCWEAALHLLWSAIDLHALFWLTAMMVPELMQTAYDVQVANILLPVLPHPALLL